MQQHTDIKQVCGDECSDEHTGTKLANMQEHTDIKQMCGDECSDDCFVAREIQWMQPVCRLILSVYA